LATLRLQENRTHKAMVIDSLVDEIINGDIAPGEKLSENRLAKRYGTSRMPVREALIELNRRGMVRVVPQVGTFVIEITPERAVSQFEVREALEVEAARLSAVRRDDEVLATLQDLLDRMQMAINDGQLKRHVTLDEEFHAVIFESAQNDVLREHYTLLKSMLHREYLAMVVSQLEGRMQRSHAEHTAVFEAIKAGDPVAADAAVRAHVTTGRIELQNALAARRIAAAQ